MIDSEHASPQTPDRASPAEAAAATGTDTTPTTGASGANVLPLHSLPGTTNVRRSPGRPRRPVLKPDADQAAYDAAVAEAEAQHISADVVVQSATFKDGASELLDRIIVKVAAESAAIGWEITQLGDQRAKERARSRRIRSLEGLARLILDRRRAQLDGGECSPHKMAQVVDMFVADIGKLAAEVLGTDIAAELMTGYRARLLDEGLVPVAG